MGLFGKIKELFAAKRYILRAMEEQDRKNGTFLHMTAEELSALPDEDLISAVLYRIDRKRDAFPDSGAGEFAQTLPEEQRAVYVIRNLDICIREEGLCGFFESDERELAAMAEDCFARIGNGVAEHSALFSGFLAENGIDVSDLSFFVLQNRARHAGKYTRYPFESFDLAYEKLPDPEPVLLAYIRGHIEVF